VAASALTITDRLAIRIYANVDTRTVTLHTENNHLCQVVTTFSKGLTSLNNLTRQVQFFGTGTSGTDFAISSSTATHTFNLPVASATNTGKLSSTDWSTFNAKQPAGNYVTLDTNQTITALKAFNTPVIFNNALNLTFGAPVTALGNNFAIYASKISNYSILSLYDADTAKYSELYFDNTTNRSYTFPNASGTIALTSNLSSYVPYTGATANVTLGLFDLYAQNVFATDTSGNWLAALSRDTATAIGALVLKSGGFTNYLQPITTVSSARTWTLPDASGTIALTSQLTGGTVTSVGLSSATSGVTIGSSPITTSGTITLAIATASGSQNGLLSSTDWTTFNGKQAALNGTGFVKASGTTITYDNSTYLTTSAAASTYLPLAGGTLTGALNGTSAVFSSTVQASAYRLTGMTAGSGALYWSSDRVTLANYNASGTVTIETGGGTTALTLASNQAATFTGALSGTSATFTNTSTFRATGNAYTNGSIILQSSTGATSTYITNVGGIFYLSNNASTDHLQIAATGAATFSSSVGVGGTLSAWGSPVVAMQVGTASINSVTSGANAGFSANRYFDGSGNRYITDGFASNFTQTNGAFAWFTAPSGTAGNAIGFTQVMTITSDGQVGIGTSSPSTFSGYTNFTIKGGSNGSNLDFQNTSGTRIASIVSNPGTDFKLEVLEAASLLFNTNGSPRMTITSGGQVGINTIDGGVQLAVKSTSTTSSSYPLFLFNSAGTGLFYVRSDGETYVSSLGTGAVTATGGVLSTTSDMNLKIEDGYINNALDKILKLNPRYFYWKEESGLPTDLRQLGFYAQEVNEALGEEVANTPKKENDKWGIYDRGMIAFLTKAIQEQQVQIEELQALIKNK
jgi:hypothetical protein